MSSEISNTVLWEGLTSSATFSPQLSLCAQAACGVTSDHRNTSIPLCHWHEGHHYQYPAKHNTGNSVHLEVLRKQPVTQEFQAPGKLLDEFSILVSLLSGVLCRFDSMFLTGCVFTITWNYL